MNNKRECRIKLAPTHPVSFLSFSIPPFLFLFHPIMTEWCSWQGAGCSRIKLYLFFALAPTALSLSSRIIPALCCKQPSDELQHKCFFTCCAAAGMVCPGPAASMVCPGAASCHLPASLPEMICTLPAFQMCVVLLFLFQMSALWSFRSLYHI